MEGKHFQSIQKGMEEKGFLVEITSLSLFPLFESYKWLFGRDQYSISMTKYYIEENECHKIVKSLLYFPFTFNSNLQFSKEKHLSKTNNKYNS